MHVPVVKFGSISIGPFCINWHFQYYSCIFSVDEFSDVDALVLLLPLKLKYSNNGQQSEFYLHFRACYCNLQIVCTSLVPGSSWMWISLLLLYKNYLLIWRGRLFILYPYPLQSIFLYILWIVYLLIYRLLFCIQIKVFPSFSCLFLIVHMSSAFCL